MFRIGHGYDIHGFTEGDSVRLGGVDIPFTQAIKAHSDGDVLLHAVGDALLGALALGDLGYFFPDNDPQWRNADSGKLLSYIVEQVHSRGFQVNNVDATVIAEAPKLASFIEAMRSNLARLLSLDLGATSVKATTNERLDAIGRREGIAVHAVVTLIAD